MELVTISGNSALYRYLYGTGLKPRCNGRVIFKLKCIGDCLGYLSEICNTGGLYLGKLRNGTNYRLESLFRI